MGITTNREGAVRWMAPEVIESGECLKKGDVYSLGCVFLEVSLYTAQHVIRDLSHRDSALGFQ